MNLTRSQHLQLREVVRWLRENPDSVLRQKQDKKSYILRRKYANAAPPMIRILSKGVTANLLGSNFNESTNLFDLESIIIDFDGIERKSKKEQAEREARRKAKREFRQAYKSELDDIHTHFVGKERELMERSHRTNMSLERFSREMRQLESARIAAERAVKERYGIIKGDDDDDE